MFPYREVGRRWRPARDEGGPGLQKHGAEARLDPDRRVQGGTRGPSTAGGVGDRPAGDSRTGLVKVGLLTQDRAQVVHLTHPSSATSPDRIRARAPHQRVRPLRPATVILDGHRTHSGGHERRPREPFTPLGRPWPPGPGARDPLRGRRLRLRARLHQRAHHRRRVPLPPDRPGHGRIGTLAAAPVGVRHQRHQAAPPLLAGDPLHRTRSGLGPLAPPPAGRGDDLPHRRPGRVAGGAHRRACGRPARGPRLPRLPLHHPARASVPHQRRRDPLPLPPPRPRPPEGADGAGARARLRPLLRRGQPLQGLLPGDPRHLRAGPRPVAARRVAPGGLRAPPGRLPDRGLPRRSCGLRNLAGARPPAGPHLVEVRRRGERPQAQGRLVPLRSFLGRRRHLGDSGWDR